MDITMRLVAAARSTGFERSAAERRRDQLLQRCRRRLLGLFSVEQACAPCAAG
jgi:hypothetical protein